ncbi:MAG TPA: type II secretion system protein [Solirubrobacterales bacterium]|nr:type II secretion system protein [Solirubrobacterales bacterium]
MACREEREAGFTIVEVLVAVLIVSIASMTTFTLLSAATRNAQRAEASQVALEYAEQELELLRSMKDENLALTASPASSANPNNPNSRVTNGTFALSRQPFGNYRNLVVNGGSLYGGGHVAGGTVAPGPTNFSSGDVSGRVYRYIVWRNDEKCSEASCPGKQDYKQIVVAVRLNTPGNQAAERGYVEVQSNFVSPTDNKEDDPLPGANGKVITAQQFFFTDTPCSASGVTTRQEPTASHLLHNTLGTCASGLQTGTTKGAPDALVLGSPPDPDPEDINNPGRYDYANDSYLDTSPDAGIGVQIRKDDTNGCHYTPVGTTNPESQVHRWVTDPVASAFVLDGNVTLEVFTQSINKAQSSGKLCIYLFKRHETGSPPVATDTMLTNSLGGTPYWTYLESPIWTTELKAKILTMTFSGTSYTIPAGDRLGVALSVERQSTPADALSFMYDHPQAPTRIEVDTSTPIDGG